MSPSEVAEGTRACIGSGWKAVLVTEPGDAQYVICAGAKP